MKMVHVASQTDLVETLRGASIRATTDSGNPCSMIAEVLGARRKNSSLTNFCEGSDWMVELGRLGRSGSTWPLDLKTKACWATLEQSE